MAYQPDKADTALILVLSGQTIQQAVARMWGSYAAYHDQAAEMEKAQIRRARAEYLAKTTPRPCRTIQASLSVPVDVWLRQCAQHSRLY